MSQAFVKLNIQDKRADILTRMDVLHDRLLEAREALNARKQKRKTKNLGQQDNTVNLHLHPQITVRATYTSIGTDVKQNQILPTNNSQNCNRQHTGSFEGSLLINGDKNHQYGVEKRHLLSQPIDDKENVGSPIKNQFMFHSPERKPNKNKSLRNVDQNDSPVRMLAHRLNCDADQNLLSNSDQETSQTAFYPLQLVSQNSMSSIPRQSFSNNKKYSTASILSGEKSRVPTSHPRFKLSNKYLELSGCQWQSAFMEQEEVNDFNHSNRSKMQFKQISFVPSIFQKKTIKPKKKKVNKPYVEITAEVRDKVANMIKQRLRYNQEVREASKKGKTAKQSHTEFLQASDLQKKLKQTLVKKVFTINHPKTEK